MKKKNPKNAQRKALMDAAERYINKGKSKPKPKKKGY
jgi:hypothetical protein